MADGKGDNKVSEDMIFDPEDIVFNPDNREPAFTIRDSGGVYDRQESLGINRDQSVLIVGCGGIGSWMGYFLGLAGVRELHLFDGDRIETHNLNRLPFTPGDIGKFKSNALSELIRISRPEALVSTYGHYRPDMFPDHLTLAQAADWVICSTDSLGSRRMVRESLLGSAAKYLELGADGMGATVTTEPAEWSTPAEEQPGYQSVPVFVGPCTLAASIAAYYVLKGVVPQETFRVDWSSAGLRIGQYQGV